MAEGNISDEECFSGTFSDSLNKWFKGQTIDDTSYIQGLTNVLEQNCICKRNYLDSTVNWFILECLHSVCSKCVSRFFRNQQIRCPYCLVSKYVGDLETNELKKDLFSRPLLQIAKTYIDRYYVIKCDLCSKKSVFVCSNCSMNICSGICLEMHSKMDVTKSHTIISLSTFSVDLLRQHFTNIPFCKEPGHQMFKVIYFCKQCNKPACVVCKELFHDSEHRVVRIDDHFEYIVKRFKKLYTSASTHLDTVDTEITTMKNEQAVQVLASAVPRRKSNPKLKYLNDIKRKLERCLKVVERSVLYKDYVGVTEVVRPIRFYFEEVCRTCQGYTGDKSMKISLHAEKKYHSLLKRARSECLLTDFIKLKHSFDDYDSNSDSGIEEETLKTQVEKDQEGLKIQAKIYDDDHNLQLETTKIRCDIGRWPKLRHILSESEFALKQVHRLQSHVIRRIAEKQMEMSLNESIYEWGGHIENGEEQKYTLSQSNHKYVKLFYEIVCSRFQYKFVHINVLGDAPLTDILTETNGTQIELDSQDVEATHQILSPPLHICWITKQDITAKALNRTVSRFLQNDPNLNDVLFVMDSNELDVTPCTDLVLENVRHTKDVSKIHLVQRKQIRKGLMDHFLNNIFDTLQTLHLVLKDCEDLEFHAKREIDVTDITEFNNPYTIQDIQNSASLADKAMQRMDLSEDASLSTKMPTDLKAAETVQFRDVIHKALLTIESTVRESNISRQNSITKLSLDDQIEHELKKFQKHGLISWSISTDTLFVFMEDNPGNVESYPTVKEEIQLIASHLLLKCEIHRVTNPVFKPLVCNGEKIFPVKDNQMSFGTLGTFAKTTADKMVVLTCGHVVNASENQTVYVNTDHRLGKCLVNGLDLDKHFDICVLDIDPEVKSTCIWNFKNEEGKECGYKLYRGKLNDIKGEKVFKIGAKTEFTRGIIFSNYEEIGRKDDSLFLIQGLNGPFAERGDSGSIVYYYDKDDYEHDNVIVVAMVTAGDYQSREGTSDLNNVALNLMLHHGLDSLREKIDILMIQKESVE